MSSRATKYPKDHRIQPTGKEKEKGTVDQIKNILWSTTKKKKPFSIALYITTFYKMVKKRKKLEGKTMKKSKKCS